MFDMAELVGSVEIVGRVEIYERGERYRRGNSLSITVPAPTV